MTTVDADRMAELETRLAGVEERMRLAEDHLTLWRIVASYGLAVDSGEADATAEIWTEDGLYDVDPVLLEGRKALRDMVSSDFHQGLIAGGVAHLMGVPHIVIDGDHAVVTNYSQVAVREQDQDAHRLWRTSTNRWEFARTAEGWQVTRRNNRLLDGRPEAPELLRLGLSLCSEPTRTP